MTGVDPRRVEFDAAGLFRVVQERRRSAGATWREVGRAAGVNPATARRLAHAPPGVDHDAEGVLRLATWVGRSLESFVDVDGVAPLEGPPAAVRLTGDRLLAALDERREREGDLSWRQVAAELGVGVRSLERVADGGRVRVRLLLRACRWCGCSVADLVDAPAGLVRQR